MSAARSLLGVTPPPRALNAEAIPEGVRWPLTLLGVEYGENLLCLSLSCSMAWLL